MAKAYQCDNCGKLITTPDNRVHINRIETHLSGATITYPSDTCFDFCDYNCMAEWAGKQQGKSEKFSYGCKYCNDEIGSNQDIVNPVGAYCRIGNKGELECGGDFTCEKIKINYCPMCGRILSSSNTKKERKQLLKPFFNIFNKSFNS